MTDNERDTKFAGFARLVIEEVYANGPQTIDVYERIIAQRAYDLAVHILEYAQDDVYYNPHSLIAQGMIPDLTQWPDLPDSE